jgi:protein TonB
VITRPNWLRRPSGEDVDRYYPDRAREREVEGRATISCTVTARGELRSCSVASETPPGNGFGQAALQMARLFRMSPQQENGQPVEGGSVRVPITFQLPE